MQVELKTLEGLKRRLLVDYPANELDQKVEDKLQELTKNAQIAGFRAGKVPLSVIKMKFGKGVRQDVINQTIMESLEEAFKQRKLTPVQSPEIDIKQKEAGKNLQYEASFEVYPEIDFKLDESIELEKLTINDDDVASMVEDKLQEILKSRAEWDEITSRAAQIGDKVKVDFVGMIDGEKFEGGQAIDFSIELGEGRFIAGFEDGIVGKQLGDEFELDLKFPDDYHKDNLSGKPVKFSVTLKKISQAKIPQLDDQFCEQHLAIKEGGVDELKRRISKTIVDEVASESKNFLKKQLYQQLVKNNSLSLPKVLVETEKKSIIEMEKQRLQAISNITKQPVSEVNHDQQQLTETAESRVNLRLLIGNYIEKNQIKVDQAKMMEIMRKQIAQFHLSADEINKWYQQDKNRIFQLESLALEEQAVDKLLDAVKIKERAVSYQEFNKLINE